MWRRARPFRPELQPGRLTRLQDAARHLAAEAEAVAGAIPCPPLELTQSVARHFTALEQGITATQVLTSRPGVHRVGDGKLWESLLLALHRAGTQLTAVIPETEPGQPRGGQVADGRG